MHAVVSKNARLTRQDFWHIKFFIDQEKFYLVLLSQKREGY